MCLFQSRSATADDRSSGYVDAPRDTNRGYEPPYGDRRQWNDNRQQQDPSMMQQRPSDDRRPPENIYRQPYSSYQQQQFDSSREPVSDRYDPTLPQGQSNPGCQGYPPNAGAVGQVPEWPDNRQQNLNQSGLYY